MKGFCTVTKWVFLGNGFVSLNQKQNLSDCRKTQPRDWGNLGSLCAHSHPPRPPSLHFVGPGGMKQSLTEDVWDVTFLTPDSLQKSLWLSNAKRLSFLQEDRKKKIENMMNLFSPPHPTPSHFLICLLYRPWKYREEWDSVPIFKVGEIPTQIIISFVLYI